MESLSTLNQNLTRRIQFCFWVFGGRANFSASLSLLVLAKIVLLCNPSLYPACAGGGGSLLVSHARVWFRHPPVGGQTPPP